MSLLDDMGSVYPDEMDPTPVGVKFFSVYQYTINDLYQLLKEDANPNKIKYIIMNNIDDLVTNYDHFTNPETRGLVQQIWTNEKFLTILLQLISEDNDILNKIESGIGVVTINKIIWDYGTCHDDSIYRMMKYIAGVINRKYISEMSVDLPYQDALEISIISKSNLNQTTVIDRLLTKLLLISNSITERACITVMVTYYRTGFSALFNRYMTEFFLDPNTNKVSHAIFSIVESMSRTQRLILLQGYFGYSEFVSNNKVSIDDLLKMLDGLCVETCKDIKMLLNNGWMNY